MYVLIGCGVGLVVAELHTKSFSNTDGCLERVDLRVSVGISIGNELSLLASKESY